MAETKKAAATEAVKDPWKEMVKIRIPKSTNGESNYEIASVNGRVFKIKKGETVEVPAPIAEVIQHSFDAQEAADEFIEANLK